MKKTRRWLAVPLVAVLGFLGFRWLGGPSVSTTDEPPTELFGRFWLESMPDKPTEYLHGTFFLEEQSVGIFQRSSAYDFHFELFQYDRDGAKLKVTFPQSDRTAKLSYAVKTCNDLPPFDLCLTLTDNPWGGPHKYYGFRDEHDEATHLPGLRDAAVRQTARAGRPD